MSGIRVNTRGDMEEISVDEIMDFIRIHIDGDEYMIMERHRFNDCYIFVYGSFNLRLPRNQYEFRSSIERLRGDAYILCISTPDSESCEFMNLPIPVFRRFYEEEVDLEYTDDEEEESYSSERTSDRDFIASEDDM